MDIVKKIIHDTIAEKMGPYIEAINNGEIEPHKIIEYDFTSEEIEYAMGKIRIKNKAQNSFTWGLDCIDSKITTPKKGKLVLLVSDENQGKSTFSYFIARKNFKKYGHNVVYFNLEQTKKEVINDMSIQYCGASKLQVRDNLHLSNPIYKKRKKDLEEQEDIVFIGRKATNVTTMKEIRERIKDVKMDYLILDNLTCISANGKDRNEDIKIISLELIEMAQTFDIPILLIHHYRKKSKKEISLFRDVHEIEGSGSLKNLVPIIVQVARLQDPTNKIEESEFHIREGKLRGGSKKESVMVLHNKGDFEPDVYFS